MHLCIVNLHRTRQSRPHTWHVHLFDIAVIAIGDRPLSLVLLFVRQSEKELRVLSATNGSNASGFDFPASLNFDVSEVRGRRRLR